jgi:thioredoxin 1
MENIKKLHDGDFIIKFGAEWCGPCRAMKTHFDKFKSNLISESKSVEVLDLDVDKSPEECHEYSITSIPHTIFIKNGEVVERFRGSKNSEELMELYKKVYE